MCDTGRDVALVSFTLEYWMVPIYYHPTDAEASRLVARKVLGVHSDSRLTRTPPALFLHHIYIVVVAF